MTTGAETPPPTRANPPPVFQPEPGPYPFPFPEPRPMPEPFPNEPSFTLGEVDMPKFGNVGLSGIIMSFCTSIEGRGGSTTLGVGSGTFARGGILPLTASILSGLPPPPPAVVLFLGAFQSVKSIFVTCFGCIVLM